MGFNTIRYPFSNQMLTEKTVDKKHLLANPELFDKTPLEIMDITIKALTDEGIAVILNNHSSASIWCCFWEEDGLWYTRKYPEDRWVKDWVMLAERYRNNPGVVAADLRNEVRISKWKGSFLPGFPRWGSGSTNDWKRAAERAGNAVLKANPNLLIIVEGINFPRYHLKGVRKKPVQLIRPSQLVYAAHNYAFTGPKDPFGAKYGDMEWNEYKKVMDEEWGYVLDPDFYDRHPVWLSEFGINPDTEKKQWYENAIRYMEERDVDFAYWPLNYGDYTTNPSGKETYGLLKSDYKTPQKDFRLEGMGKLMKTNISWEYAQAKKCLNPDYQSLMFDISDAYEGSDLTDQYPDSFNANCALDSRAVGLSTGTKFFKSYARSLLCSRKGWGLTGGLSALIENKDKDSPAANSRTKKDWAEGYTKLECGNNQYITAVLQAKKGFRLKVTGIQCTSALQKIMLGTDCKSRSMKDGDNRAINTPKDWSFGYHKGQCGENEYMAGVSAKSGYPHSILCCKK